ncbi:MAG: glycoside hydrolase family 38 C-terminal domain-containing protein [Clostridiales bacterium]|nr:glycoside hydrolase family 38 C-terminal domain-containing protein [Clostridiales bacterium]HBM80733.1 alpha-mannosidase [Clostridiaceae bacterium]
MLVDRKIMSKLSQIESRYEKYRYKKVADVPCEYWETFEHFRKEPGSAEGAIWKAAAPGTKWGDNWLTCWFRGDARIPAECDGKKVFIRAKTGGETLFIVNERYMGVFDNNHPVVMMDKSVRAGKAYHLSFEAYSGHYIPGSAPNDHNIPPYPGCKTFDGIELVLEREDVTGFVFDLKVLWQVAQVLDDNSLRKNKIIKGLSDVYSVIDAMPDETPEESWRPEIAKARRIMEPLLDAKNGSTVPYMGIVAHSHIDTAWLWPIAETWRKCARTFSSVLNLMDQYPDFKFIQSSPYQTSVIRKYYPEIYGRIKKRVVEGRWEPNGAMWVEPDCNIPSGESFVRQLLFGQKATREMFGYTSDTLWLPDVFGYSAALPQILQGCDVEFFCTTKISWNDTNRFPYDTFIWKGIDGSSVTAHFHNIHCWPDPATLTEQWNRVQHKDVQDRRLVAYGYGDGGGGPMAEMLEVAKRVKNLEGCPKAEHTTVSDFMKGIKMDLKDIPKWSGELYLELHRGTLTSKAKIKRGNRKTEIAVRDAEFLSTMAALNGKPYPSNKLNELWKTLLTDQFHDILPGSSIERVNDEAIDDFEHCIEGAKNISKKALETFAGTALADTGKIMAVNTLNWDRNGEILLDAAKENQYAIGENIKSQWVEDVEGNKKLIASGIHIPAFSGKVISMAYESHPQKSPFVVNGNMVETPFAAVSFDSIGRIVSFIDKESGRDIVKKDGSLNTLWIGEDIPEAWDNWDIDRDQRLKMSIGRGFIKRYVAADGPLQLRLRCEYNIGSASYMVQDIVFHSETPRVDFESVIDWKEKHKLLKAGFELDVLADSARHEIQYGYVERPTHTNLPQDRARFEVCAHKWTDISETGFGVALLNDCKYGVGVEDGEIRLSLMKSGLHPDTRGDEGRHLFNYALLPHSTGFSVQSVVRPAYELNIPVVSVKAGEGAKDMKGILSVDSPNIIVECIKWAESENAFVVRLYDAAKTGKRVNLKFNVDIKGVDLTNLLEEKAVPLKLNDGNVSFYVKPFEIKTLICKI